MLHLLTTLPRRNEWVFSAPPAPPAACASPTNRTSALAKPLVSKGLPCTGRAVRSQDRRSVWKSRGRGCANSGSQTRRHGRKALHGAPAGIRAASCWKLKYVYESGSSPVVDLQHVQSRRQRQQINHGADTNDPLEDRLDHGYRSIEFSRQIVSMIHGEDDRWPGLGHGETPDPKTM